MGSFTGEEIRTDFINLNNSFNNLKNVRFPFTKYTFNHFWNIQIR